MAIWNDCIQYLGSVLPEHDVHTYVDPLEATETSTSLLLFAPNQVFLQQVRRRVLDHIREFLASADGREMDVQLHVNVTDEAPAAAAADARPAEPGPRNARLIPNFTFEQFVTGAANTIAWSKARQVAEHPGGYGDNPYLIYGGVGLGKTHLLHAIGHGVLAAHPELRVVYVNSGQFVENFIAAAKENRLPEFQRLYRDPDVLLIDDIQFLAGKPGSEEQMLHIYHVLAERGAQLAVTCDKHPQDIDKLSQRLQTRLAGGMQCEVKPPCMATRIGILHRKAALRETALPDDAARFIAENAAGSVRDLESALARVHMQALCSKSPVSLACAEEALRDFAPMRNRRISLARIRQCVCEHFSITAEAFNSRRRLRQIVLPRQMAMALAHELTQLSLASIGEAFGGRDHSTVLYAKRRIGRYRSEDPQIDRDWQDLQHKLLN